MRRVGPDAWLLPPGRPSVDVQLARMRISRRDAADKGPAPRPYPWHVGDFRGRDEDRDMFQPGQHGPDRRRRAVADQVLLLHVDEPPGTEDRAQPDVLDCHLP